jgi:hypothetical protein
MPTVTSTSSMTHSSLSFATFNVTDADPTLGIDTGVLQLVTIAREGSKQDGADEVDGIADSEGLKDGSVEKLG